MRRCRRQAWEAKNEKQRADRKTDPLKDTTVADCEVGRKPAGRNGHNAEVKEYAGEPEPNSW